MAGSKFSEEVARVVQALRGDLSYEQASIRLRNTLSGNAIRILESGKIGREDTVRKVARGFWERACELYGDQIRGRFGDCTQDIVSDWLAELAGFGLRHARPIPGAPRLPGELTYDPDLDELRGEAYEGLKDLQGQDVRAVVEVIRSIRNARGLE